MNLGILHGAQNTELLAVIGGKTARFDWTKFTVHHEIPKILYCTFYERGCKFRIQIYHMPQIIRSDILFLSGSRYMINAIDQSATLGACIGSNYAFI